MGYPFDRLDGRCFSETKFLIHALRLRLFSTLYGLPWLPFFVHSVLTLTLGGLYYRLNADIAEVLFIVLMISSYAFILLIPAYYAISPKSFLEKDKINFVDKSYFSNLNTKASRVSLASWKMSIFSVISLLFFANWYIHYSSGKSVDKNFYVAQTVGTLDSKVDLTTRVATSNASDNEKGITSFLQVYFKEIISVLLALLAINITSFWNTDQIFGRVWQYCCGIYKEIIATSGSDKQRRDILRLNLCIDIMDHDMWNSTQFGVFFKSEVRRFAKILNDAKADPASSLGKRLQIENQNDSKYHNHMKAFLSQISKSSEGSTIYLVHLDLRKTLSWLSAYLEEENVTAAAVEYNDAYGYANTLPPIT